MHKYISYLSLHKNLPQNLVASNNKHYLTVSVGRELGSGLAGRFWLRLLSRCQLGLQFSEGLTVTETWKDPFPR